MRIGLAYDLKEAVPVSPSGPEDALEEYDSAGTVDLIAGSLRGLGHCVTRLGGGWEFLESIRTERVNFVFNIAEGRGTYRSREAQVPSVLEMLGIPYSGSDPQCLAVCLDKPLTKTLLAAAGVRTPSFKTTGQPGGVSWPRLRYPVIIKPAYEGSSKGVRSGSLAETPLEAAELADRLAQCYRQPMMLEEFIDGDEVTVGMVGNHPPRVVGVMRVVPRQSHRHFIYSLETKRDWEVLVDYECPARLGDDTLRELEEFSLKTFEILGCRDFARLDFRVGADGLPYFIEINPLPGLGNHSDLVIMVGMLGWSHQELTGAILDAALGRYSRWAPV